MRATLLLSATLSLFATSAFAQSSYNVVVEPVAPTFDTIINAPIEYDENGVVKAQHFKADDLTEEQYQALLREADRVRAYQASTGYQGYTTADTIVESTAPTYTYQTEAPAPMITYETEAAPLVEIEMFDTATTSPKIHTVAKGDTLYNISRRYDTSVDAIKTENNLSSNALSLGQAIRIPGISVESMNTTVLQPIFASAPMQDGFVTRRVVEPLATATPIQSGTQIYAVLPKDTLYSISRRTCVGVKDLISSNNIANPNALKPGQRLTLPAGHCLAN